MCNKILGKRSRNYYKGFNERQVDYIKEKFSVMSVKSPNKSDDFFILDKDKFTEEYKLSAKLAEKFFDAVNFDENSGVDEYEFICAVHSFCNMTISELGAILYDMITKN